MGKDDVEFIKIRDDISIFLFEEFNISLETRGRDYFIAHSEIV